MGRGSEESFFQGRRINEQGVHEKVLSVVTWERKIKTTITYHVTPSRMATTEKTEALVRMWRTEPLCTVNENVNWCSHYGNSVEFSQKLKTKNQKK